MKLQIVESSYVDIMKGEKHYRYILEIEGRGITWTGSTAEKFSGAEVYNKLTRYLSNNCIEYNINHYPRYNNIPGVESEVIFEQEVSDKFLKEMFVDRRIKELEEDFK